MEHNIIQLDVVKAVAAVKSAIRQTRRTMMLNANKNALALYYGIGRYISQSQKKSNWGDKVLENISSLLQQEMPGLKEFSKTQLKRMRAFYLAWKDYYSTPSFPLNNDNIAGIANATNYEEVIISPLTTEQFDKSTLDAFLTVQFSHHYEILQRAETLDERLFSSIRLQVDISQLLRMEEYESQLNR